MMIMKIVIVVLLLFSGLNTRPQDIIALEGMITIEGHIKNPTGNCVALSFPDPFVFSLITECVPVDRNSGYFQVAIPNDRSGNVLLSYGDSDNIFLYVKKGSRNVFNWDGKNFSATLDVSGEDRSLNAFLIDYYKNKQDLTDALDTVTSFAGLVQIVSQKNKSDFKLLETYDPVLNDADYQKCADDVFFENMKFIISHPQFSGYNFDDFTSFFTFPFIIRYDRWFKKMRAQKMEEMVGSGNSKEDIERYGWSKAELAFRYHSIFRDTAALKNSLRYRSFLMEYFYGLERNIKNRNLGVHTMSSIENYSKFLEGVVGSRGVIDFLIADRINTSLLGTVAIDEAVFNKDITYVKDTFLQKELRYRYQLLIAKAKANQNPRFVFYNENGKMDSLSNYRGKYVYLSFWSTSCAPCIQEIQRLNKTKELDKYKAGGKVVFLYVSLDDSKEEWLASVKKYKPGGINVRPLHGWDDEFVRGIGIQAIPRYIIINPDGSVQNRYAEGPEDLMIVGATK